MPRLLTLVLLALLAGASTASAQTPVKPVPCNDVVQITDPNDVAAPDKDILRVFFRFDGGKATANIELETAPPALGQGATSTSYRVLYELGSARRYVALKLSRTLPLGDPTVAYEHGTHSGTLADESGFTKGGDTTGRVFGGDKGIIQIDIPEVAGGTSGTVLARPVAVVREGNQLSSAWVERAPGGTNAAADEGVGFDYTVAPCTPAVDPTDVDADGVPDDRDNCKAENNPGQEDLDGDKAGDACDTDDDADNLSDATEAGRGTDPRKPDTDGDGKRDDVDRCPREPNASADGCSPPGASPVPGGGTQSANAAGAVIITSGSKRIKRGDSYFVQGRIEPARASVPLEVAGVDGKGRVVAVASAITGSDGTWSTSLEVPTTMAVLARVEKTFSKPVLVFLVPAVSLNAKVKRRFDKTFTASFTGSTRPLLNGRVTIQRQSGSRWVKVRSAAVRRGRFAVTKAGLKPGRYRAQVVETGVPSVKALSRAKRLR